MTLLEESPTSRRFHLRCAHPTPRDLSALERDEAIDACLVVQNAEALSVTFESADVTFAVPLRQMPYGVQRATSHLTEFVDLSRSTWSVVSEEVRR